MIGVRVVTERQRILDFDIENRPLSYLGMDWTSAEVTSIAWSWIGEEPISVLLLGIDGKYTDENGISYPAQEAFRRFRDVLASADMATGHYIRKHDLPIMNAAMIENNLLPLPSVLAQDTCLDLVRRKDLSASQENLAALLGLPEPKHHMSQTEWRQANRLTEEGVAGARTRVVSDVIQHKALRAELLKRKLLRAPKRWNP